MAGVNNSLLSGHLNSEDRAEWVATLRSRGAFLWAQAVKEQLATYQQQLAREDSEVEMRRLQGKIEALEWWLQMPQAVVAPTTQPQVRR